MKPESTITHYRTEVAEYDIIKQMAVALKQELPKLHEMEQQLLPDEFYDVAKNFISIME